MLNSVLTLRHSNIYRTYFRNHDLETFFFSSGRKKERRWMKPKYLYTKIVTFFLIHCVLIMGWFNLLLCPGMDR
ncbi:hypothetical protein BHM03_00033938 [Ensete ventricosum]|nr:hypothetical protein BHM03_00033938 [Ensete ventricosum]